MTPGILLTIAFAGALLTYLLGKVSSRARDYCAVIVSLIVVGATAVIYGKSLEQILPFKFLGLPLVLRTNMLAWFFAITIAVVGALSIIFSLSYIKGRESADLYYFLMLLINAGMLGIVLSGDLLSFYIFWEIMSWSTFLLISYNRGTALSAGMKYIIMSLAGSAAYLVAALSIYAKCGTLIISSLSTMLRTVSPGYTLFILILGFITFGIKNAVLPFHTWLPDAHSEAPSPFSAVLSGILIKMGTYGLLLFLYVLVGLKTFVDLKCGILSVQSVLCWLGAITIVIPTFIALLQDDAKRLLAWHSIGQVGYIILGIGFGTGLSIAGGTFHVMNHATFKALLFLSIGAVEYRTGGVRDLNSLGGLMKKMPITFIGALVGAFGIIGIPLTNGFVSKWLIYKALISNGAPFLAFAALIGTWGTLLSFYKFIHNIFLGQLPERYKDIKKAPVSMQLPILIYAAIIVLFGILPGIPLKVINIFVNSFGLDSLQVSLWGIGSETGVLNTINICAVILVATIVAWLVFRMARRSVPLSQEDSYAAGAAIPKDKYHHTVDFYNPLYRMIGPYLKDVIDQFYYWIARRVEMLCDGIRHVYTGDVGNYVAYIVLFVALLITAQIWWQPW